MSIMDRIRLFQCGKSNPRAYISSYHKYQIDVKPEGVVMLLFSESVTS